MVIDMNKIKTVFITGGTRGIGRAASELFLKKGYRVAISYASSDAEAQKMREKYGESFIAVKCDVSKSAEVNIAFDTIEKAFGGVDILINNAGISSQKMLCDVSEDEWDEMFAVNMKGMFNTCKAALGHMVHQKSGKIINLSSIWGICGASCEVCYSASKAAVIGFTKALAKELAPSGICVNCVAPGVIDTDMNKVHDKETLAALAEETPVGRLGTPEEIAHLIVFLAEKDSDFITGQVISPNGGIVI